MALVRSLESIRSSARGLPEMSAYRPLISSIVFTCENGEPGDASTGQALRSSVSKLQKLALNDQRALKRAAEFMDLRAQAGLAKGRGPQRRALADHNLQQTHQLALAPVRGFAGGGGGPSVESIIGGGCGGGGGSKGGMPPWSEAPPPVMKSEGKEAAEDFDDDDDAVLAQLEKLERQVARDRRDRAVGGLPGASGSVVGGQVGRGGSGRAGLGLYGPPPRGEAKWEDDLDCYAAEGKESGLKGIGDSGDGGHSGGGDAAYPSYGPGGSSEAKDADLAADLECLARGLDFEPDLEDRNDSNDDIGREGGGGEEGGGEDDDENAIDEGQLLEMESQLNSMAAMPWQTLDQAALAADKEAGFIHPSGFSPVPSPGPSRGRLVPSGGGGGHKDDGGGGSGVAQPDSWFASALASRAAAATAAESLAAAERKDEGGVGAAREAKGQGGDDDDDDGAAAAALAASQASAASFEAARSAEQVSSLPHSPARRTMLCVATAGTSLFFCTLLTSGWRWPCVHRAPQALGERLTALGAALSIAGRLCGSVSAAASSLGGVRHAAAFVAKVRRPWNNAAALPQGLGFLWLTVAVESCRLFFGRRATTGGGPWHSSHVSRPAPCLSPLSSARTFCPCRPDMPGARLRAHTRARPCAAADGAPAGRRPGQAARRGGRPQLPRGRSLGPGAGHRRGPRAPK